MRPAIATALQVAGMLLVTVATSARPPTRIQDSRDLLVGRPVTVSFINGDRYVQRDLNDYLDATIGPSAPESTHPDDYARRMNRAYLLRPHPSVATLRRYFVTAAAEFAVPVPLLMVVCQDENNWIQSGP